MRRVTPMSPPGTGWSTSTGERGSTSPRSMSASVVISQSRRAALARTTGRSPRSPAPRSSQACRSAPASKRAAWRGRSWRSAGAGLHPPRSAQPWSGQADRRQAVAGSAATARQRHGRSPDSRRGKLVDLYDLIAEVAAAAGLHVAAGRMVTLIDPLAACSTTKGEPGATSPRSMSSFGAISHMRRPARATTRAEVFQVASARPFSSE